MIKNKLARAILRINEEIIRTIEYFQPLGYTQKQILETLESDHKVDLSDLY